MSKFKALKKKKQNRACLRIAELIKKNGLVSDYTAQALQRKLTVSKREGNAYFFISEIVFTEILLLLCFALIGAFFPLFIPVGLIMFIAIPFATVNKLNRSYEKNIAEIENELPRFADFISSSLKETRDIVSIFSGFAEGTSPAFKKELQRTGADFKTYGIEKALILLERRVMIDGLSEISRTLIGIARGDTDSSYFVILAYDMKEKNLQKKRIEALKSPGKMRKYCMFLLLCFVASYFTIFAVYITQTVSEMF
jgi:Flp pilus assembly protein TadB